MSDAPLTDDELAEIQDRVMAYSSKQMVRHEVRVLIAALRASRAEVERLKEAILDIDAHATPLRLLLVSIVFGVFMVIGTYLAYLLVT